MLASRILVVEDERIIALNLRQQLLSLGYDVPPSVASGEQALLRIDASPPDLILMDINLKGALDGIDTASRIPAAFGIPLIYLTAYSSDATLSRAAATNPYGYLLKPFSARELHAMIQVSLARRRADRASETNVERCLQARKMDALRELAGGVADEMHDLLTVLYKQLDVSGYHAIGEPTLTRSVQETFSAAIEKEGLIGQMLDFAGRRTLTPATVAPRQFVDGLLPHLCRIVGDGITVRHQSPDDLLPMRIDPGQLARALANLARNAREAMEDGGSLTIECQNAILDPGHTSGDDATIDRYVLLSVTDSGIGMTDHTIERAFEPFFTTKPAGAASGLGLSLVFGFVRQSGGHISIDSKPRGGTTVRLYLPAAPDEMLVFTPEHGAPDGLARPEFAAPDLAAPDLAAPDLAAPDLAAQVRPLPRAMEFAAGESTASKHPEARPLAAPILWQQIESALYANDRLETDPLRCRLVVEQLPRRNGWDWTVWRPGMADETARHGRASSAVSAMAAAEVAAREWGLAPR